VPKGLHKPVHRTICSSKSQQLIGAKNRTRFAKSRKYRRAIFSESTTIENSYSCAMKQITSFLEPSSWITSG
jgi:hypothetical protein